MCRFQLRASDAKTMTSTRDNDKNFEKDILFSITIILLILVSSILVLILIYNLF